jgi:hypothetical protein
MKYFILLFAMLFSLQISFAQIDGDNIFSEDQIITIELTFSQVGYIDSLELNYDSGTYMKADLTLTDNTGTYTFADIGVRYKGNSSYSHPGDKKSFKIDFNKYTSGQNYDGLKKLNLSNGFKDPSLMREKIFFDVCREAGVPAPRANFANVYFNGTLLGFYTVVEQIDDQFLDWKILDDDGNLFKAGDNFGGGPDGGGNPADLVYYGADQSLYEERYELKSNEDVNDWSDLIDFIDFINNSTSTDFENDLASRIELQEYLRSAALDNLFGNMDSYTESARNYYVYHNLTTDKWEWIKWDGNEAFASYPAQGVNALTLPLNYHSVDRPLLENVFDSPALYEEYLTEICYLTENFFNSDYIDPMIDDFKTMIQSSVYADNNKMYTDANFDTVIENDITGGGGPMGGTTYGLKPFIASKNTFANSQVDCSLYSDVEEISTTAVSLYPNPSPSMTRLEWGEEAILSISITNVLGQLVHQENVDGKSAIEINTSALVQGIYFVNLYAKSDVISLEMSVVE